MDEATQDVTSSHAPDAGNRCGGIRRRVRGSQVDPAVRPLGVVVGDVFAERPLEMTPTEDEREGCIYSDHAADLGFVPSARHGQKTPWLTI